MINLEELYQQGRIFEKSKVLKDRKAKGVFYTPWEIVDYMVRNTLDSSDIISNPYIKILDLSCGAGYFLLHVFKLLKKKFELNLQEIIYNNPALEGVLTYDSIGRFIVENNIWGADIDAEAVDLVRDTLNKAAGFCCKSNIVCADALLSGIEYTEHEWFWSSRFDCIIGNPPYLGHKGASKEYKDKLYKYFGEVYRDKSDVYYCFFKRGIDLLKDGGVLCYITSRYFMEGPSAASLRGYLSSFDIEELIDFGDTKVFEDAGVSVCIIKLVKQPVTNTVIVRRINTSNQNMQSGLDLNSFESYSIENSLLKKDGWMLLEPKRLELYKVIDYQSTHELGDIFDSYQGIITGCDKAFVLNEEQAEALNIEKELLKPWIKNSQIEKCHIKPSDKKLIYTDFIDAPESFPNAITFASTYREKLMQRRECQKGYRAWYQLQWGRKSECFEGNKIVYPYKASENRFAVDTDGRFCSADVYSLVLKKEFQGCFSLDYLAAFLNSKLVEFYFKSFAKKISPTFYDYYPNKVLKIKLKLNSINTSLEDSARLLQKCKNAAERRCIMQHIDREVYKMYNLSKEHIDIIEG